MSQTDKNDQDFSHARADSVSPALARQIYEQAKSKKPEPKDTPTPPPDKTDKP